MLLSLNDPQFYMEMSHQTYMMTCVIRFVKYPRKRSLIKLARQPCHITHFSLSHSNMILFLLKNWIQCDCIVLTLYWSNFKNLHPKKFNKKHLKTPAYFSKYHLFKIPLKWNFFIACFSIFYFIYECMSISLCNWSTDCLSAWTKHISTILWSHILVSLILKRGAIREVTEGVSFKM